MNVGKVTGSTELLPALSDSLGHLLWRCGAVVLDALDRALPPDADVHAYAVLLALDDEGSRSQQSLADAICTSRTTMTKVATQLAAHDLVTRERNAQDRRSYALARTPAGAQAVRRWHRDVERVEQELTASLDAAGRERLHALLLRVVAPQLGPDTPAELRASVGFLVHRAHQRAHREFAEVLEPLGLEPRFLGSLIALEAMGPASQAELARGLGMTGASMVPIVDAMEERGLVERRPLEGDRRVYALHPTRRARTALEKGRGVARTGGAPSLQVLDDAERSELTALLARLVTRS
ncbi:hypothetical protein LUZ63_020326 [Rhynchospora breviuscula]|uniref:HTH marR-type domain-containing protein n=1 Tax=Rhynchospora breviuscula TaxID=2022672 RepID=A0A9P9Z8Z9_9POAL|nr:hypothetical protein LUZ63_020326 [Rhynchospora breviuscula]